MLDIREDWRRGEEEWWWWWSQSMLV